MEDTETAEEDAAKIVETARLLLLKPCGFQWAKPGKQRRFSKRNRSIKNQDGHDIIPYGGRELLLIFDGRRHYR